MITIIVTNAGRAALVNADHSGTAPVTIASMGVSATAVTANKTATTLPGEIKRIPTVSGTVVDADTIHLIVRDQGTDDYSIRSFALFLADGTLFALYGQAAPLLNKTDQSIMLFGLDIRFADIDATSLTFGDANFINPPASETMKGVAEIATQAETDAGTDDTRIVTPKKLAARLASLLASWGADIWRASNDGSGSGMDADMVDGRHGSEFALLIGAIFTGLVKIMVAGRGLFTVGAGVGGYQGVSLQHTGVNGSTYGVGYYDFVNEAGIVTGHMFQGYNADGSTFIRFGLTPAGSRTTDRRVDTLSFNTTYAYFNGNVIWHAGNDGAGSGLDADLLDGIDSSGFIKASTNVWQLTAEGRRTFYFASDGSVYFGQSGDGWWNWQRTSDSASVMSLTNGGELTTIGSIMARDGGTGAFSKMQPNGDVFASREGATTGYYFFGNTGSRYVGYDGTNYLLNGAWLYVNGGFVWTANNDGAGSGSDADLLDGQQGSWYADILARLGWTPIQQGGGVGQLGNKLFFGWSGSRVKATVDVNDLGNIVFDQHISDVWRVNNDGSGSGMDTDLWRGQSPAQMFGGGANGNGEWYRIPGRIIQRGRLAGTWAQDAVVQVTFPTPYAAVPSIQHIGLTNGLFTAGTFKDAWAEVIEDTITLNGFKVYIQSGTNNGYLDSFGWSCDAPA